jgi:3-oxoacyl-[acyl-carrier protein] reductase
VTSYDEFRQYATRPPQKAATALNRYGHVDEIAAMVAFVAGPESSYITGANLTVDGGLNA